MADSITSIYLEDAVGEIEPWEEAASVQSDEEIVFHDGACTLHEPTDDEKADRIGKDLQAYAGEPLTALHLNYAEWTRWGAHEIGNFMEASHALEEVTLQYDRDRAPSITSTRTLQSLGEALANNTTAKIRQLRLLWVKLQWKSVAPFCSLVQESKTLQKLVLVDVEMDDSAKTKLSSAISASQSLESISFLNISNVIIAAILEGMSDTCPSSLKMLEFERSSASKEEGEEADLEVSGLGDLLKAESCQLEKLNFNMVQLARPSLEGIHQGLIGSSTVQELILRDCSIPLSACILLQSTLQQTTSVQKLQLDCFPIEGASEVIAALQSNASVTQCELLNLPMGCGPALKSVLAGNRTLQTLHLNNSDRVLANPRVDVVPAQDIQALAEGLKQNRTLRSLSLKAVGIEEQGIAHLAKSLSTSSRDDNTTPVASLDLALDWDSISIESLDRFSKALKRPNCRLRHLKLELEETVNISLNAGLVRFLEGIEQSNAKLESIYLEPSNEGEGLAPPVFCRLAHALLEVKNLQKLVLLFGIDGELMWREMDPQIISMVQSDLFVALAKNYSLEHVQFGNVMYRSHSDDDREFWRDVSFFGMRNRLLKGLDTGNITEEVTSVAAARSLARSMVKEEIATRKPWTRRHWKRQRDIKRHELNELSLFFLCLQHLPHLLVGGYSSSGTALQQQSGAGDASTEGPFLPLMELD